MRWPWIKAEADLARELAGHFEQLVEDFQREGLSLAEARRKARLEFGGVEQVKEDCRDERRWQFWSILGRDLRIGWRMLGKSPVVTAAAVLSLALAIGANTALFSLMDLVLWRALPGVPEPERLSLVVWHSAGVDRDLTDFAAGSMYKSADGGRVGDFFPYVAFEKVRAAAAGRAEIAPYSYTQRVSASYGGRSSAVEERPVGANFFTVLGVPAQAGRLFAAADDDAGAARTVVVADSFWRNQMGSDPQALGRPVRINGELHEVIGVLPEDFAGIGLGDPAELYVPLRQGAWIAGEAARRDLFRDPRGWWVQMIARRAPRTAAEPLAEQMDSVFRSTWTAQPEQGPGPRLRLDPAQRGIATVERQFRRPLLVLLPMVGLVLLIACANIANLLLARGAARRKEMALRVSLGASRGRLLAQMLAESAWLAVLGGALGVWVAAVTANVLIALVPSGDFSRLPDVALNGRMLAAACAASLAALAVFGLFPAWRASRVDAAPSLKEGPVSSGKAPGRWTAARVLVAAQVALTLLLVAAAALFARNLGGIRNIDAGFERANLLLFDLAPGESGYTGERLAQFYVALQRQLPTAPGVTAAGLASIRMMNDGGFWGAVRAPGLAAPVNVALNQVTPEFFPALGLRLTGGRWLTAADAASEARPVLVSEELAAKLGGGAALGRRVRLGEKADDPRHEVVGIVSNAMYNRLTERPDVVYQPFDAAKTASATVMVRTAGPPAAALSGIREALARLDKDLPMIRVLTMEQQISEGLRQERLFAYLCGAFGGLALLLSAIGLYGVISYSVARRKGEIGVRVALGASQGQVLSLVLREGLALAAAGLLVGGPLLWGAARLVERQLLHGMEPLDPASIGIAVAGLGVCALVAAWLPAWRAARLDPAAALRND